MPRLIVTVADDSDIPQTVGKVQAAISPKSIRIEYGLRLISALNGLKSLIGIKQKPLPPRPAEVAAPIEMVINDDLPNIIALTDEELEVISRGESCLRVHGKRLGEPKSEELNGAFFAMKDAYLYLQRHSKKYDSMQIIVKSMREYVPSSIAYLTNACLWDSRLENLTQEQINELALKKQIPYAFVQWLFLKLNKIEPPPLRLPTSYIKKLHDETIQLIVEYKHDNSDNAGYLEPACKTITQAIELAEKLKAKCRYARIKIHKSHDSMRRYNSPTFVWDSRIGYTDDRIEIKWKTERLPKIVSLDEMHPTANRIECKIVAFDENHRSIFHSEGYNKTPYELKGHFVRLDDFISHEMNAPDAEHAKYFQCVTLQELNLVTDRHPPCSVLWDSRIEVKPEIRPEIIEKSHKKFRAIVWINNFRHMYDCDHRCEAITHILNEISKHKHDTYGIVKNTTNMRTIYDSRSPQLYV